MSAKGQTEHAPSRILLGWLWHNYLRRHWRLLIVALFFMALEGSMLGALSYMMQPMFDRVFVEGDDAAIWWVGGAFFGIFLVRALASMAQKSALAVISQRSAAHLRADLLAHMMIQDGSFHQTHPPGFLLQRVQGDVGAISTVWNLIISGTGRDLIALIILFGVALSVDWQWTLVTCIGIPLLVMPSALLQRFVRARAREARDVAAKLATRLDEVFHGIVQIKLNSLESYQSRRYVRQTEDLIRAQVRSSIGAAAVPGMIDIMAGIGFVGVLFFGGSEIISGEKTVGAFMSFFAAIGLAFDPLRRLASITATWQAAAAAIERLKELMEVTPEIQSPANPKPAPTDCPRITLRDVSLSYGETGVLHGTSFEAEAGRTTALVGASGAGKTTVFNLLTRLVDPTEGEVLISGTRVQDMALPDLRALFSVVLQDTNLFDESLRENILMGREDVSDARLQEVLEAAHVADFAEGLPLGLDTPVGPRGTALSGGQRQRVAIARALLRDTPILLLDEATSALDTRSERKVQAALDRLSEGRTTIVIAHRLSTIQQADKIVVMDKGRVVDFGTHDQLIDRGGIYANLHALQFQTEET